MSDFAKAIMKKKQDKPKMANVDVGSLSEVASGSLSTDLPVKKEMFRPRAPRKGKTDETFRFIRDKIKSNPGSKEYKSQLKEFLRFNPDYKTAK